MVQVLQEIPPLELFHAQDATEGLSLLDKLKPSVVVLDESVIEECELFLDSLAHNHPPIVMQINKHHLKKCQQALHREDINYISKNDSLAGIHETLVTVANIAQRGCKEVTQ